MDRLMVSVSGVRGTIGSTLTPQVACDFGCTFGTRLGAGRTVVLGSDTRPSGSTVRAAVTAGLLSAGVSVVDLGVVTTPGAALMVRRLAADGGIVITASHNPPAYNGIKFLDSSGTALTARQAGELRELWESRRFAFQPADRQGRLRSDATTGEKHIAAVCETVEVSRIAQAGLHVVLDSINGAGCEVTPRLLDRLGCTLTHLNAEPDGRFAHEPEPIEPNLTGLCEAVREAGAAAGFAQDPDADRLVVVDEEGRFIGEEYTLALCCAHVLSKRRGRLAANLVTSRMIDDVAAEAGVEVVRAPTGEANVAEAIAREGCIFGGEGNGGVIDPRVVPVRNSLVGMALILEYLAETGEPLSRLVGKIPAYRMKKVKFPCPAGAAEEIARRCREVFAAREGARFNADDGLRIDLPVGWVSVRASNTEPILRLTAEARAEADAEALIEEVREIAEAVIAERT